ncbi:BspA family leucine-rich repeat surface protein [Xylocopilactobacillus apicola]|uniref:BspA family leucine-rich repeat surface protein n=1 Tax=Xylocopilactobacillus apicola TaxID=2932184 RepID=A0AAU9DGY9_9LACO|nr:BspA family leucine-rich repeat surface protein [Xylocopilactobacillus apicola]BDR59235.1 hypothetical protein XA3_16760 [Xylocopilactobacillus apicola]
MNWRKIKRLLLLITVIAVLFVFWHVMPNVDTHADQASLHGSSSKFKTPSLNELADPFKTKGKLVSSRGNIGPQIAGTVVQTNDFHLFVNSQINSSNQPYEVLNWDSVVDSSDGYVIQRTNDAALPSNEAAWQLPPTNYGKQITILNVYPDNCNYLQTWMNQLDPATGQPVSMGLINVVPVSFADFNSNPDQYLKDAAGNYQYDGIYFGSEDGNGGNGPNNDLNATSYAATVAYGQTGRSIILGHDTVYYQHPYLMQFGPSLGLKILPGFPSWGGNVGLGSTKVKFSMNGFLNQYPYKFGLDQTLEIKFSHSSGQYYLYQGGAQRWMEYEPPFSFADEAKEINYLDENSNQVSGDNGQRIGDNNFYLVTKNNYAMIQTGHSIWNGMSACTPDEAKIIANMIYYTSTLNLSTQGEDHTVKDSAAPEMPTVAGTTDRDKATLQIKASDVGTDYFYRVKAKTASMTKYSDVVKSTITSGIKGFVYQIDDNPNGVVTPVKDANGEVTNLNLTADATGLGTINVNRADGIKKYLHVVAVDQNNNFDLTRTKTISLGDYLWWTVDSSNVLTIYPHALNWDRDLFTWLDGYGYPHQDWPWYQSFDQITKVVISPGVTVDGSIYNLFAKLKNMTTITGIEQLDTSQVTSMAGMFRDCYALTSLDVSHFDTSQVTDLSAMFSNCRVLTSLDVTHFDTRQVTNMSELFSNCLLLANLDVSNFVTSRVTSMSKMFQDCRVLPSINVTNFDTSQVTTMSQMFDSCYKVPNLDVSHFDTAKVTNMMSMFSMCRSLLSIDVTHFDTSQVTSMNGMFNFCELFTSLDVTHFNTSKVTDIGRMFGSCRKITTLDIRNFDTSQVTDMAAMFCYDIKMTDLYFDPDKFKTDQVTRMSSMFIHCESLKQLDVTKFNTAKVTQMSGMFSGCESLTELDVTHFETTHVSDMDWMFESCKNLTTIDVSHFDGNHLKKVNSMFSNCLKLTTLDLTNFNNRYSSLSGRERMFYNTPDLWKITLGPNMVIDDYIGNIGSGFPGKKINDLDHPTKKYFATSYNWQEVGPGTDPHDPKGPIITSEQLRRESVTRHDTRTYVWDQNGKQDLAVSNTLVDLGNQNFTFAGREVLSSVQYVTETDNRNSRKDLTWKVEAAVSKDLQLDTDSTKIIKGNPLWFHDTATGNKYNLTSTAQTVYNGTAGYIGTDYQDRVPVSWKLGFKTEPINIPAPGHYTGQITFTLVNVDEI